MLSMMFENRADEWTSVIGEDVQIYREIDSIGKTSTYFNLEQVQMSQIFFK